LTADLLRRQPAVIFATGAPAVSAASAATKTTPIVFLTGENPVSAGLVDSMNRPGGNLTGITILTAALETKRLGLLHELGLPGSRIGVLLNPDYPPAKSQLTDVEKAAAALGLELVVLRAGNDREIDATFDELAQRSVRALAVLSDPFF